MQNSGAAATGGGDEPAIRNQMIEIIVLPALATEGKIILCFLFYSKIICRLPSSVSNVLNLKCRSRLLQQLP
jgi:hypothetical protein